MCSSRMSCYGRAPARGDFLAFLGEPPEAGQAGMGNEWHGMRSRDRGFGCTADRSAAAGCDRGAQDGCGSDLASARARRSSDGQRRRRSVFDEQAVGAALHGRQQGSSRSRSAMRSASVPVWRVPSTCRGRSSRSRRAITKPSLVSRSTASRARPCSGQRRMVHQHAARCRSPCPTRPRSWCSCASPRRSAFSMIIRLAFGTSTPTSMTVVATSRSSSRP